MTSAEPSSAGAVRLEGVTKRFGQVTAVDDLDLHVAPGTFTTLLGPSGCGKTTLLRMIAGLVAPDRGSVFVDGRDVTALPPDRRGVGMVFQDYALFPHMSVRRNVEYGPRRRRMSRSATKEVANRVLATLDLGPMADRYPHQLSGGQQQRVALGRVLALEPRVLLLDEPLSNLDAQLRVRLRGELKALQSRLGVTALYVTHDQDEALALSDTVVVMEGGRIQQVGGPESVYLRPANRFVASFVGRANLLPVTAVGRSGAGAVTAEWRGLRLDLVLPDERVPDAGDTGFAVVRPEALRLGPASGPGLANRVRQALEGRVVATEFGGPARSYTIEVDHVAEPWTAQAPQAEPVRFTPGDRVSLEVVGDASWAW